MRTINREWHAANRMPGNPTRAQRARWHFEHAAACGCRTPSESEQQLISEHGASLRDDEGGSLPT